MTLNRARLEIQKALVKAEAASKAKTDFLFSMSHDIRTPMNAIRGVLHLLDEQQEKPARRKEYIRKMEDSSELLLSIINNVLEMSQIEGGEAVLEETAWNAEQMMDSVCSLIVSQLQEKNITFKKTVDVQIGISKEFMSHLFEVFSRENDITHSKIAGTGLGMAIVKRLTELMGGTVEVESEIGKGTKLTVIIPHRIASENDILNGKTEEKAPGDFGGKRILLVEDNDLNAEIAEELLAEMGLEVERAQDGSICVSIMEQANGG